MTGTSLHADGAAGIRGPTTTLPAMRATLRPAVRLLLTIQAEVRSGRLVWGRAESERALMIVSGMVVGAEGQPESFFEYLGRTLLVPSTTMAAVERRVRDLFIPVEGELSRTLGITIEEIAARRRDFTLAQLTDLAVGGAEASGARFVEGEVPMPGAACRVAPATALADSLTDLCVRGTLDLGFLPGGLRPTRYFPRLSGLLGSAFPWPLPLPRAGGESAEVILARVGNDRVVALWLMVTAGLLAAEPSDEARRRLMAAVPGGLVARDLGPIATLEALEKRLAEDPFNQEAIEAIERLAGDEGWPEILIEMQERQIAKAPPVQRGYYLLRLAALAEIARVPRQRVPEIVLLGRRCIPGDMRLAAAQAAEAFEAGDSARAAEILAEAGIPWPPAGPSPVEPARGGGEAEAHPSSGARPADDPITPLVAALAAGDTSAVDAWMAGALDDLPLLRRTIDVLLETAREGAGGDGAGGRPARLSQFTEAMSRALCVVPRSEAPSRGSEAARSEALLLLADALAVFDKAGAVAAALAAVEAAPEHEPALDRLEAFALSTGDAESLGRGFAVVEGRLEGAHNRSAFAYRVGRAFEVRFHRPDLAIEAYLRALRHQPRSGAVLSSIERLARLADDPKPLEDAYRELAGRSEGPQRSYWRSRLVELGVEPAAAVEDTGWGDLLEDSSSVDMLGALSEKPAEEDARPPEAREVDAAGGIADAVLRATPALGVRLEAAPAAAPEPPAAEPEPGGFRETLRLGGAVPAAVRPPEAPAAEPAPEAVQAADDEPAPEAVQAVDDGMEKTEVVSPEEAIDQDTFMRAVAGLREAESRAEGEAASRDDPSWIGDDVEVSFEGVLDVRPAEVPVLESVPLAVEAPPGTPPAAPVVAAAEAPAAVESSPAEEAGRRLEADVADMDALRMLRTAWQAEGRPGLVWAADGILATFDPSVTPATAPAPSPEPADGVLGRFGPWGADILHRAMALVWDHAGSTFAQNLAASGVRPADQVSPLAGTPLANAVASFSETLLFFRYQVYRRSSGAGFEVVRTVPPSMIVSVDPDFPRPSLPVEVAAGIASCMSPHVLAMSLPHDERTALLEGLLAAFGPPGGTEKLSSRAAVVAQDLWQFIPPRGQISLREVLGSNPLPEVDRWADEVRARCLLLAMHVTRDVPAGLRLAMAFEGAVAAIPLDETRFRRAIGRSGLLRRLIRMVLSDLFWGAFWKRDAG